MSKILRNTFSWSVSRDATFRECPRQYYFQYYGSWAGWEPDAPQRVRDLYILKQLKNRHAWAGQIVHDCIKHSLDNVSRGIAVLDAAEILAITRDRMRMDFRSSRAQRYRVNPSNCALFEHEYAVDIPHGKWLEVAEHVDRCLGTFYASPIWERLRDSAPADFLEIEQFSTFGLDGVEVTIRLDCAVREGERVVVWDWKTGKQESPDAAFQLASYAAYIAHRYGTPVANVVCRRFELFRGVVHEQAVSDRSIEEVYSYIRGSIRDMQSLLDNPQKNIAAEERFHRVSRREVCYHCNYLRLCAPDLGDGAK